MIPAKRLAEIQERGDQTLYPFELAELVTVYEAARDLVSTEGRVNFQIAYAKLTQTLMPEPTK